MGVSPSKAPRGRPIVPEADRLHIYNIRLTRAQIEKLAGLGGVAWIRDKIDKAKKKAPEGAKPFG